MTMPWPAIVLGLISVFTLLGCSPASERQLSDYSTRLQRVADIDVKQTQPLDVPALPAARELLQPLPDIRLDMLDAWATRHCGLDSLIAERNSSLGRVQSHSLRLHYELRVLNQLEQCVRHDDISPELQQQLGTIQRQKIASIEAAWFNMLHAEQTLRQQLHGKSRLLPLATTEALYETQAALQQLNQLRTAIFNQQWQDATAIDSEAALRVLHRYDTLAVLQYSLRYTASWMDAINAPLLAIVPAQLCPAQRASEQLGILSTVFMKFFAETLQPYFTLHQRYYLALWPELEQLYQDSPMLPVLQSRYQHSHQQLLANILRHVGWWQQLNQQCPVGLTER